MAVDNADELVADIITQMALVHGSISTIGSDLEEATPIVLQVVYQATADAALAYDAAIQAYDADIDVTTVGGVTLGDAPPVMATNLLEQTTDVEQEGLLVVARAYVVRAGANVLNSPG